MSAIFGCVYLDGRPLPAEAAPAMVQAMKGWGPDGISSRVEGSALLGFANLAIEPESVREAMPQQMDEDITLLFTAAARLDNREELCDHFGILLAERATTPNGRLVLKAYRAWGEDCSRRLFGDWSLAAWDGRRRRLFLARDQLGNTGLYYYHRPPLFAFASAPEGLFALADVQRRIEERYLASYLTIFSLGEEDETCWRDVRQLLAGSSLSVTLEGLRSTRYWEMHPCASLTGRADEDVVLGFLERYRAAVRVRLRSRRPLGATLSSGLDSGSVTALAAQELKRQGQVLTAFTSVPLFPAAHLVAPARADEWPLAQAVSIRYDNVEHQAVDAAAVSPLTGIRRAVAILHEPQHAAANEFWLMALHDAAQERNLGVLLTGQLGNGGVSWSGGRDHIFHLFAAGKWDQGVKAMVQWKRQHGRSWIRTIAAHLVKPPLRPYWKRTQGLVRGAARPWEDYAAIHPEFAKRIGLRQAMKTAGHDPTFSRPRSPFEERRLTLLANGVMAGPLWHKMGAAFGLEVRDPTADLRLLEYCLSVPGEQDTYSGGERMLIRRAMEGILPPEVQWNTIRGRQAADVAYRLLRHREEMDAALNRLTTNPEVTAILDLDLMRRVWRELQARVTAKTSSRATTLLLRGIMCGCFLEEAADFRQATH